MSGTRYFELMNLMVAARQAKGWSQTDLAKRLGCSLATIHRHETFATTPDAKLFLHWADMLNVDLGSPISSHLTKAVTQEQAMD